MPAVCRLPGDVRQKRTAVFWRLPFAVLFFPCFGAALCGMTSCRISPAGGECGADAGRQMPGAGFLPLSGVMPNRTGSGNAPRGPSLRPGAVCPRFSIISGVCQESEASRFLRQDVIKTLSGRFCVPFYCFAKPVSLPFCRFMLYRMIMLRMSMSSSERPYESSCESPVFSCR